MASDPRLLTYMETALKHADPWEVAGAVIVRLSRGAFEQVGARDIESVKVEPGERVLTVTGQEAAVREVSEFIKRADEMAEKVKNKEEDLSTTEPNWVVTPGEPAAPPLTDLGALRADFWPEDESADDFIAMVRESRRSRRSRTIE